MENPRVNGRKENLKIRTEKNAKETKETIAKINKAKSWFFNCGERLSLTLFLMVLDPKLRTN